MPTVADVLLQRLREWGVPRIYGYPGDGIDGIQAAMSRRQGRDAIPFVQSHHEELSAFMATAHAKWTGRPGVCLATSGPGAIHLLNGLYDAKLDRQPVVAIVGQQAATTRGGSYRQEIDLHSLFKDVASDYLVTVTTPQQLPMVVDRAMRTAMARMAPTVLIVPTDVQTREYSEPTHDAEMVPGSLGVTEPKVIPHGEDLRSAAEIINDGERVAILIGQGARDAADLVEQLAERTGAGVAKALLGKDVLPDDLSYVTGPIGLLGSEASSTLMRECDTLVVIGSNMPYSRFLPEFGQARGVQIDVDAHNIGLRYPMEENLVGDARQTLRALLPMIEPKEDRTWRERIEGAVAEWWELVEEHAHVHGDPVNPQRVFYELSPRLPDGVVVSADAGSGTSWFARDLKMRRGMRASLSGTLATMGPAVPYAIAAKFCHPDRPAIACVGDGAMQMNGINGLITIARYWREWEDPRCVVLVLDHGDRRDLPAFDYAQYARMLGLEGVRIDDEDEVGAAWDRVWAADRPVVVDALVDPDIPPIPMHLDPEEVARSGGDPDGLGFVG